MLTPSHVLCASMALLNPSSSLAPFAGAGETDGMRFGRSVVALTDLAAPTDLSTVKSETALMAPTLLVNVFSSVFRFSKYF